jgi:hypothetical protein
MTKKTATKKKTEEYPFTDVSIHLNWVEFQDENGQWYRFEKAGGGICRVYLKRGSAFVFEKVIRSSGSKPRLLYRDYWKSEVARG